MFCLQLGVQSFPNLLSSELFPNDARARCKGFIRAVSAIFSFAMLKVFPYLEDNLGLYGSFWSLASGTVNGSKCNGPRIEFTCAVLILILPIIYLCVPEAKDVELDQVSGEPHTAPQMFPNKNQ